MDAIADEETPDINFTADDSETPDIDFAGNTEQHEVDIDDLDEPDQYVEPADEENELDDDTEAAGATAKKDKTVDNRLLRLPLARVKHIMKLDPDVAIISQECAVLITKATELFVESLAREAFTHTAQAKKKTVQKRDVDQAIAAVDALMFLEGAMNS